MKFSSIFDRIASLVCLAVFAFASPAFASSSANVGFVDGALWPSHDASADYDNPTVQSVGVFEIYAITKDDGAIGLSYYRRETPDLFDIDALVALNRASMATIKRSSAHRVHRFEVVHTVARV